MRSLLTTWSHPAAEAEREPALIPDDTRKSSMRIAILVFLLALPQLAAAHPGWGIVVDSRGSVYFTDLERVWKIDAEGRATVFIEDVHTHDLYIDDADTLYGEHEWYEESTGTFHTRYWKASPTGRVTNIPEEEAARFFDRWDRHGNRYRLTNDREEAVVIKTTPQGETSRLAGGAFGYADGPAHEARFRLFGTSAWGPDGRLYFTNGGLLRTLDADGTFATLAGPEQGFAHSVQGNGRPRYSSLLGVAVAGDGTVYFADIDQRKVFKLTSGGPVDVALATGKLWIPVGVTLVGSDVYVLEYRRDFASPTNRVGRSGPRVRKLARDGSATVVGIADK